MRFVDTIVIHCADTPASMDVGVKEIEEWHIKRGFSSIGYHFVIRRDGTVERGRSVFEAGAHAKGSNRNSIGVCLIGGKGGFNFTDRQMVYLHSLLEDFETVFGDLKILGHRDLPNVSKECPCFDVKAWRSENGMDS